MANALSALAFFEMASRVQLKCRILTTFQGLGGDGHSPPGDCGQVREEPGGGVVVIIVIITIAVDIIIFVFHNHQHHD